MVGFRVFDVGLLLVWLVWFLRLRDDGEDPPEEGGGGGGETPDPKPKRGPSGGGLRLPLGRWAPADRSRLERGPRRPDRRRGPEPPIRRPLPARVRVPVVEPSRLTDR
jgi:hypothetical protein